MRPKTGIVIPAREPENTKLRLSSVLDENERSSLTYAMLNRVLHAAETSLAKKIVLVVSEIRPYRKIGLGLSKVELIQENRFHGGVNEAMQEGIQYMENEEAIQSFMLMPSDLPFVTTFVINAAIDSFKDYDALINPSSNLNGTALLGFKKANQIPLHYDDDSYRKHISEFEKMKLKYKLMKLDEFSSDVDTREDLTNTIRLYHALDTKDLIGKIFNSK